MMINELEGGDEQEPLPNPYLFLVLAQGLTWQLDPTVITERVEMAH